MVVEHVCTGRANAKAKTRSHAKNKFKAEMNVLKNENLPEGAQRYVEAKVEGLAKANLEVNLRLIA